MDMILKSRDETENQIFSNINEFSQYKIDQLTKSQKFSELDCQISWPVCVLNMEAHFKINNNLTLKNENSTYIEENFLSFQEKNFTDTSDNDILINRMEHHCYSKIIRTSIIEDFDFMNHSNKVNEKEKNIDNNDLITNLDDSITSTDSDREGRMFNKYITNLSNMRKLFNFIFRWAIIKIKKCLLKRAFRA